MCNFFCPNSHQQPKVEVRLVTPKICLDNVIFNFFTFIEASNRSRDSLMWSPKLVLEQFLSLKYAFNPHLYKSSKRLLTEIDDVNKKLT